MRPIPNKLFRPCDEHKIQFGTLNPNGELTNTRSIKQSDIAKCPFFILVPEHFQSDGSCKCNDAEHRKMMIREWGYKKSQFKGIPLKGQGRKRFAGKISQEESIELQNTLEPLVLKYGKTEVRHEIEYVINWCIGED